MADQDFIPYTPTGTPDFIPAAPFGPQKPPAPLRYDYRTGNTVDEAGNIVSTAPAPTTSTRMGLAGTGRGSEAQEAPPETMKVGRLVHRGEATSRPDFIAYQPPKLSGPMTVEEFQRRTGPQSIQEGLTTPFGMGRDIQAALTVPGNSAIANTIQMAQGMAVPKNAALMAAAVAAPEAVQPAIAALFAGQMAPDIIADALTGHPVRAAAQGAIAAAPFAHLLKGTYGRSPLHNPPAPLADTPGSDLRVAGPPPIQESGTAGGVGAAGIGRELAAASNLTAEREAIARQFLTPAGDEYPGTPVVTPTAESPAVVKTSTPRARKTAPPPMAQESASTQPTDAEGVARAVVPDDQFMSAKRTQEIVDLANQVVDKHRAGVTLPPKPDWMDNTTFRTLVKGVKDSFKSGALRSGIGPLGEAGGEPLITAKFVKDLLGRGVADQIYGEEGIVKPSDLSEGVKRGLDKARDIFVEQGSYTKRTAPSAFDAARQYDSAAALTEASVDKITDTVRPLPPDVRDKFQSMLNADKQIARGAKPHVPEADVEAYFNRPDVRKVLPDYRGAVNDVYGPLRAGAGYGDYNVYGKYSKAYSPSIAESHINAAVEGRAAPTQKPLLVPNKVPGEQSFTGTSKSYLPDLAASHEFRLTGLTRASGQRQVLSALVRENALKAVPKEFDGTMPYRGQQVQATKVVLADLGLRKGDLARIGLPESGVMPTRILHEIEPIFKKSTKPYAPEEKSRAMMALMKGFLFSTGELGAHAVTLPSIASSRTRVTTGIKPLDALLNTVGPVKLAARMKDMVGATRFTPKEVSDARVFAAKAGIYRDNPLRGGADIREILPSPGTTALYAKRGIFSNVVTGMVKSMKAQGATDAQIVEALSSLPSRKNSFVPRFQQIVESIMGPGFYSTGKAALQAGARGMTPKNILGALAFYSVAGKAADEDHKWWWERNLLPGQFIRGADSEGKSMQWDLATLDRIARVQREVPGKVFQESQLNLPNETGKEKAMRVGETGLLALINQAIRPAVSGPTASIASGATGLVPYLVKSKDKTSWEPIHTPVSKLPYDHPDRLKALLESILPGSQVLAGDAGADYRYNAPAGEKMTNINRLLRAFGQMPGKTWEEDRNLRNALLTEYGNRSGSVKGRKRAAAEAQGRAAAKR